MKIIIFGNAGSGKTTMAKRIMEDHKLAYLSLDDITWNEKFIRKPMEESLALLQQFITQHDQWIVEGCYGDLIEAALPHCTELRFLNPGVDACIDHCKGRDWEPDKFSSPQEQQDMLDQLIEWVREYESREDEFGFKRHKDIFETYAGFKKEYT